MGPNRGSCRKPRGSGARFLASGVEEAPTLDGVPLRILLLGALFLPASVAAGAGGETLRCAAELELTRAAAELLLASKPLTSSTLMAALRAVGSDAVGVRALAYRDEAEARTWLTALAGRVDAPLVCGVAHAQERHLLLATARGGSLAPIDEQDALVRGTLAPGFGKAELVVADGTGEVQRFAVDGAQLAAGVALSPSLPRPVQVQLLAHGRQGPRPVAERVLGAGEPSAPGEPPASAEPGAPHAAAHAAPHAAEDAPSALLGQIDALRATAGRPSLRGNALLDRAAQSHAVHVCESGRVAHVLEPGGDPVQRLRDVGVTARRVGETVARTDSTAAALRAFMDSPSHRLTLLERGFTDAGIGRASDSRGKLCVVVLLAEWPRFAGR